MLISRQSVRAAAVIAIGLACMLLALAPLALAGEQATPKQTIQAAQTNGAGTLSAVRTGAPLTITAFKVTAQSAQAGARATGTAYRLAATSWVQTSTAVRATLSAGATSLKATVSAARTAIATQLAPLADPATAITTYADKVLGITVKVESARKATTADPAGLPLTDAGAAVVKSVYGLAAVNDYARLSNGAASLSYGLGVVSTDKLDVAVIDSSVAVYALTVKQTGTLDAASALALAGTTYPKLAKLAYKPYPVQRGWAFLASRAEGLADSRTFKGGPAWVMVYVLPGANGTAVVSATVVLGGFLLLAPR
jgi:hypothetical protein